MRQALPVGSRLAAIGHAYRVHLRDRGNEPPFRATVAFLPTFVLVGALTDEIKVGEAGKTSSSARSTSTTWSPA